METTEAFFDIGLDKRCGTYVLFNTTEPFVTTHMDLEDIILSKIKQSEKTKNHMISLICGLLNCNSETQNVVTRGKGMEGGGW